MRQWFGFPGFRPTALLLFSFIWFSVGLGLLTRPGSLNSEHRLPLEYLPIWFRVLLWWAPAVCGLVASVWPPGKDRWGWVALSIPASFRVASYSFAALLGWIDPTFAISWIVIIGLLILVSFWPEPPKAVDPDVD